MALNSQKILEKIQKNSLYLLAFILPLFFLPFTPNVLIYPKQLLALFLVSLSFLSWIFLQYQKEKIVIKKATFVYLTLIILLISASLSTAFSLWWPGSLWGWPLEISQSLISLLIFVLFFFLLINAFEKKEEIWIFLTFFVLGTSLCALFAIFQFLGIFLLPWTFTQNPAFTLLGTPTLCGFFFLFVLPLCFYLISIAEGILKKFLVFCAFIFVFAILLINTQILWFFLALQSLFLFFLLQKEKERTLFRVFIGASLFLLTLGLFFSLIRIPIYGVPLRAPEVTLSFASELEIAKGVFQKGIKEILLGTGPGTFVYAYSQFRSPLLNKTFVWGTRFPQGSSFIFDWFLTLGILGGVFLLFFQIQILKNTLKLPKIDRIFFIFLAPPLFLFFLFQFFYPANFPLFFLFFLLAGLSCNFLFQKKIIFEGKKFWQKDFIAGIFLFVLLGTFTLFYFEAKYLQAQILYAKALQKKKLEDSIFLLEKATETTPWQDLYWRDLSQLYLALAERISRDKNIEKAQKERIVQENVRKALESINKATSLNFHNVANWNVRGFIYRNLIGIRGAGELALESYKRAHQLEPASPYPLGEIGRVYILMAQNFEKEGKRKEKEQSLKYALNYLEKALKVKEDYALAQYLLAVVYDQQNKIKKAIESLENTSSLAPRDAGVKFQLGVLYFKAREYQKSKEIFQQTLKLNPDYDDARYMLAFSLLRVGEREKAKKEFERLSQKYPQNENLRKILKDLKKGAFLEKTEFPPFLEKPEELK